MKHYIIPIFIPHFGCPHACIFCNQQKITGMDTPVTPEEITEILTFHFQQMTRPYWVEAAFYGGSFTALPRKVQSSLLAPAASQVTAGKLQGIRLSTRPDCISRSNLDLLLSMGVRTVELGAQSFSAQVLQQAERGHSAADIRTASSAIQKAGLALGIQLMLGLPGDDAAARTLSLQETLKIHPDMVRLYPTLVLRGTKLARLYEEGIYQPLSLEQAIAAAGRMKLALENAGIPVIRTGLQSSPELADPAVVLAGPYHPAFGELVENWIFRKLLERGLQEGGTRSGAITIHHTARETSKVRGLKNRNVHWLSEEYPRLEVLFSADGKMPGALQFDTGVRCWTAEKSKLHIDEEEERCGH